jgi:hypothetical protein
MPKPDRPGHYFESPLERIVAVHWADEEVPPLPGSATITTGDGVTFTLDLSGVTGGTISSPAYPPFIIFIPSDPTHAYHYEITFSGTISPAPITGSGSATYSIDDFISFGPPGSLEWESDVITIVGVVSLPDGGAFGGSVSGTLPAGAATKQVTGVVRITGTWGGNLHESYTFHVTQTPIIP